MDSNNTLKNKTILEKLPSYEANRAVVVKSTRVAVIFWASVLLLAGGSLLAFLLGGEYNKKNSFQGIVTISLIGSGYTITETGSSGSYKKIQDAVDLRQPAIEVNAITIISSSSTIYNQNRLKGNEKSPETNSCESELFCNVESDCQNKTYAVGKLTGKCLRSLRCEMEGWCPALFPTPELIEGLDSNIKLKLKVNAFFKEKDKQHNELEITLDEILNKAGENYGKVQKEGALLLVRLVYDCNINNRANCAPTVNVIRLDNSSGGKNSGFRVYETNYNKPKDSIENNKDFYYRDLKDIRGIRIIFTIDGEMKESSIELLLLGIGSAFGLVGLAHTLTEKLIQFVLEEGKIYNHKISVDLDEEKRHIDELCRKVVEDKLAEYGASLKFEKENEVGLEMGKEIEEPVNKEDLEDDWD